MAEGFASLSQFLNSTLNNGYTVNQALNQMSIIKAVRVYSIVLDEDHPRFKELGGWDALGTIEYIEVNNPQPGPNLPIARPLLSNIKNYPLINEIIYIISLPDTKIGKITSNKLHYYINTVALWNHPHHNAYPSNSNEKPSTQQKGYNQTELGNTSKITNQTLEINLGNTFIERSNIHPLLPFEGDVVYEGRWGNSVRIGSTVKNSPNTWSSIGTNGDPILILRNGQGKQTEEGWLPVVENINNDESSIYLTSTQNIPLEVASTNYNSYKTAPTSPNKYSGKQVIVSSGRLTFNSSEDHILLSSAKSISLSSNSGVNIDTSQFIVQSSNVYLGSKDATESMIKGDLLITELQSLLNQIQLLSTALQAVPQAASAATLVLSELPKISANLEKTKSKVNKLI
jgi:hypothetical protein